MAPRPLEKIGQLIITLKAKMKGKRRRWRRKEDEGEDLEENEETVE